MVELVKRLRHELPTAVCCLDAPGAWGEQLKTEGVPVLALNRASGFQPRLGQAIARFAARQGTTVLHCHQYSPFVYGALSRVFSPRLRVLFTEHGRLSDAPPSMKRRRANQLLSRLPARSFTVSRELREHLLAEGFPPGKVGVVYNGIDVGPRPPAPARVEMRRTLGLTEDRFVVATVARLDPVKDLGTLIDAIGLMPESSRPTLLIAGDGPERATLESRAAALAAPERIRFLGHREDARAVLAACDAFANSSISEGVSLTILEAMAAVLPIVATAVGGTPEIIDETCARLVPSRSAAALAAALDSLARDRALGASLAAAGRQRVEERFTLDRMVGEYRQAYYDAHENRV